jgi:hypothetical protein
MPTGTAEAMASSPPGCSRAGTAAGSASGTIDPRCSRPWMIVSQVSVCATGFRLWQRGDRSGTWRTRRSRSSGQRGPRARGAESSRRVASSVTSAGEHDHGPDGDAGRDPRMIKDREAGISSAGSSTPQSSTPRRSRRRSEPQGPRDLPRDRAQHQRRPDLSPRRPILISPGVVPEERA